MDRHEVERVPQRHPGRRRSGQRSSPSNAAIAGAIGGGVALLAIAVGVVLQKAGHEAPPQIARTDRDELKTLPKAPTAPALNRSIRQSPRLSQRAQKTSEAASAARSESPTGAAANPSGTQSSAATEQTSPQGAAEEAEHRPAEPRQRRIEAPKEVPPEPPLKAVAWDVTVDPAIDSLRFGSGRAVKIPYPQGYGARGSHYIVDFFDAQVPFVSIGNNEFDGSVREIWDIERQRLIGRLGGIRLPAVCPVTISRDGRYFAASEVHPLPGGVHVWDLKEKRTLGKLPLDQEAPLVTICGDSRLIAGGGRDSRMSAWQLPSGEPEYTFDIPAKNVKESVCFSPGGRYMAFCALELQDVSLQIYDLENAGRIAGHATGTLPNEPAECEGIAFSDDGRELAARVGERFLVWDVATGNLAENFELRVDPAEETAASAGPPIQWFPDRQRWLLDSYLILDRERQGIAASFPVDPALGRTPRRVLSDSQVLGVSVTSGSGIALVSMPLPAQDDAKEGDKQPAEPVEPGTID